MPKNVALTGNDAIAYGMKQIDPDVVAAYPITPQTSLMEKFSEYVSDGKVDTELILVESEHSAMSACVGASAAGARTMTATSANGLALMWEVVYVASGLRLPIVMPVANRALSGPINIHCDHSDAMGARDSGWIQLWCENAQEAYENLIQAVRIAEHTDVRLPCMVCFDGFVISHGMENVTLFDDADVKKFIGEYQPKVSLLDANNPVTIGPFDLQDSYFEHRRQEAEGMRNASRVIKEVGEEFSDEFNTQRYGLIEEYRLKDAEQAIVCLGSTAGTAKVVIDELRNEGRKAGLLKIRSLRPFPQDEIRQALKHLKTVSVLDRSDSLNAVGGPLFSEVRSSLYAKADFPVVNYIYGLGGRDIDMNDIKKIFEGQPKEELTYLGVR